jgi:hypothetical protein
MQDARTGIPFKEASLGEGVTDWTRLPTKAVVETCQSIGWELAAHGAGATPFPNHRPNTSLLMPSRFHPKMVQTPVVRCQLKSLNTELGFATIVLRSHCGSFCVCEPTQNLVCLPTRLFRDRMADRFPCFVRCAWARACRRNDDVRGCCGRCRHPGREQDISSRVLQTPEAGHKTGETGPNIARPELRILRCQS